MTEIVSGSVTHQVLLRSLAPMIRAIGASLGPNGRPTLIDLGGRVRQATSGVHIARETCGAAGVNGVAQKLMRETLVAADRDLGDGTARLAVMAEASFRAGVTLSAGTRDAMPIAEGMKELREEVSRLLASETCMAGSDEIISCAGAESELAAAISEAHGKTGTTATIELTRGARQGVSTSYGVGFGFSTETISSPLQHGEPTVLTDVHIIAADDIISDFGALLPVIEGFTQKRKSLLIVARDVNGSALAVLERNRKAGILSVAVVRPADAGPRAAEIIEDLAIATGARLVAERSGVTLSALKPTMLGCATELRFQAGRVELRGPGGRAEDVARRIAQLTAEIDRNRYLSLDREHAERRRARLRGQWAVIEIAGQSEFETEDLLRDGRSALANLRFAAMAGVIPGGGRLWTRIARRLVATATDSTKVDASARRAVAAGLCSIDHHLARNGSSDALGDMADAHRSPLNLRPAYDPLRLSQLIADQALSLASMMLRVDAAVVR